MKPRHFFIVTTLSAVLLYGGQLVLSFGIAMGDNLKNAQQDQRAYTSANRNCSTNGCL